MASSQSFSRIHRRISLSPDPQSPFERGGAIKNDCDPAAAFLGLFHFCQLRLKTKPCAVIHSRYSGFVTRRSQFPYFGFIPVLAAPRHTKWRLAQPPIEALLRPR